MIHKLCLIVFSLLISCFSIAQENAMYGNVKSDNKDSNTNVPPEFIFTPTIGVGVGMFSFYGDLYTKKFQAPMVSRLAYDLSVSQPITDAIKLNFYVLFGKLGANERLVQNNRNLNFESQIRAGGVNLQYTFDHFLPTKRTASPYITLGIESLEFLSKTDLKDKNGNTYYYWADGSTRSKDELAPDASSSVELVRDYTYESDIRELNLDGFGKYAERSFAIPVGAGAIFKLNDFMNFKIGSTMHFTFTDYIDGVTEKSVGNRQGNKKNDNFMMTSFALQYNLGYKQKIKKKISKEQLEIYENTDFLALENDDYDKDGVIDFKDLCGGTPVGAKVDENGCPFDGDEDGVLDYADEELASRKGAVVNTKGVELTDAMILAQHRRFMDETGEFAEVENRDVNEIKAGQKEYAVKLGTFKKGLPPKLMTKFLSINDIASGNIDNGETIYTAGKFSDYEAAEARKKELIKDGLQNVTLVYKLNGKYYDAESTLASKNTNGSKTDNTTTIAKVDTKNSSSTTTNNGGTTKGGTNSKSSSKSITNGSLNVPGVVLRVQLGAYKKQLSKAVFKDIDNLVEIKTDDGLYKYMTGSFTSMDAAAKHKVEMSTNGYQGAFITAYKDGKRITLKEAGATFDTESNSIETAENETTSGVNKNLVKFRVQVGVFKNQIPNDILSKYSKLKDLTGEKTKSGLTKYVVGTFTSYKQAEAYKNELATKNGLPDAFVVALFNGEYISIQEAMELLK